MWKAKAAVFHYISGDKINDYCNDCVSLWFLVSIKEMEKEKFSLQSDSDNYSDQVNDLNPVSVTLYSAALV